MEGGNCDTVLRNRRVLCAIVSYVVDARISSVGRDGHWANVCEISGPARNEYLFGLYKNSDPVRMKF